MCLLGGEVDLKVLFVSFFRFFLEFTLFLISGSPSIKNTICCNCNAGIPFKHTFGSREEERAMFLFSC